MDGIMSKENTSQIKDLLMPQLENNKIELNSNSMYKINIYGLILMWMHEWERIDITYMENTPDNWFRYSSS